MFWLAILKYIFYVCSALMMIAYIIIVALSKYVMPAI